jgi:small subunit ribosomal protein S17
MESNSNQAVERGSRRVLQGIVTSNAMNKTIGVKVERLFKHPKYKKYVRRHDKYLAHDEEGKANVGDTVEIVECRPLSKRKRWRLTNVVSVAVLDGGDL